tara:strand:+ start:1954 stop:2661 length:708 start_codon:yes stop_codon:yes gene_type:complete
MTQSKKPIIVSFDGNIGSGKSSIIRYFEKNFEKFCNVKGDPCKICFLEEPVDIWESIVDSRDGKNIIEKFYGNNKKYGFAFQMMAYITRLSLFKETLSKDYDIIFTERSIFSDKNVFAEMLYKDKKINEIEYQIYNKWFDEFSDCINKMKFVYIRTIPEICNKRVKNRARTGESIPLSYLQNCHYHHDIWLYSPDILEKGEVLIIDGNEEINTSLFIDNIYYDITMEKVFNFIKS